MAKTKKKYVLANKSSVYESMEEVSERLVALAKDGNDVSALVIGVYVGVPEINTSLAVNVNGKVKRLNKSNIEWKQVHSGVTATPGIVVETIPDVKAPTVEAEEDADRENGGVCSFCAEPWVKSVVVEGFNTYLCEYHRKLESQLASI